MLLQTFGLGDAHHISPALDPLTIPRVCSPLHAQRTYSYMYVRYEQSICTGMDNWTRAFPIEPATDPMGATMKLKNGARGTHA